MASSCEIEQSHRLYASGHEASDGDLSVLTGCGRSAVALYFYRLGTKAGGAERMICALADALVERGLRVHLVSWDPPDAQSFYPFNPAIRWSRLGFSPGVVDKLRRSLALMRAGGPS